MMKEAPLYPRSARCELRQLQQDDLSVVQRILEENAGFRERIEAPGTPFEAARDIVSKAEVPPGGTPENAHHLLIVRSDTQTPVGFCCLYHGYPHEDALYIGDFVLRPALHRQGWGRELVAAIDSWAITQHIKEIRLAVNHGNWAGFRFWVAVGYDHISKVVGDPSLDGPFATMIELRKDLRRREGIVHSYNLVAEAYGESFFDELAGKPFDRDLLKRYVGLLPKGEVCDLGCGPGHVCRFLREQGADAFGMDLSPEMVEVARKRNQDVGLRFVQGDMRSLPLADGALAGVVAFYSVIHLELQTVPRALEEMCRVLVPGGRLLLAVHAGEGVVNTDEWFEQPVSVFATLFAEEELHRALHMAGFQVDEVFKRAPYDFEYPTERLYVLASKPS